MNAIELEVMRHLYASIAEEMGVALMRSAFSPNIKERLDFSCALFDAQGQIFQRWAGTINESQLEAVVTEMLAQAGPGPT